MATGKGQEFIDKYKMQGVGKETWLIMYRKGHITLDELCECIELTDAEVEQFKNEQIDICPSPSPTLDDLVADANETRSRLDTVENAILDLLLKG